MKEVLYSILIDDWDLAKMSFDDKKDLQDNAPQSRPICACVTTVLQT